MKSSTLLFLPALAAADLLPDPGWNRHPVDPLPPMGPCSRALSSTRPVMGAYVAQCDGQGNYETVQCRGSTGYCWCVDSQTGVEVDGTRQGPGRTPVTEASCAAAAAAAAAKAPTATADGPPAGCTTWFDGCNTCTRSSDSDPLMCTMMACFAPGVSACRGWAVGAGPTPARPPVAVDPGFSRPLAPSAAQAGGRCAAGFCENPADCPQCAAGLTCNVPAGMMCAGTCYGTCAAPSAAAPPAGNNPACWGGAFTAARCCDTAHGRSGDTSCWSGDFTYSTCCSAPAAPAAPAVAACSGYPCCAARDVCANICANLPADDFCANVGACAPGVPAGCAGAGGH